MMKRIATLLCVTLLTTACQEHLPAVIPTIPSPVPTPAPNTKQGGPRSIPGIGISVGQSVNARIDVDAPQGFENWDATARCRQFDLTVPSSGNLTVQLTWAPVSGVWDPDLLFVRPNGDWEWLGDAPTPRSRTISVDGIGIYRIVVLSYLFVAQDVTMSTKWQ